MLGREARLERGKRKRERKRERERDREREEMKGGWVLQLGEARGGMGEIRRGVKREKIVSYLKNR